MEPVEFYIYDDEVLCRYEDGETQRLDEHNLELIEKIYSQIQSNYTEAFDALEKLYGKSKPNLPYYKYVLVRRFIKCNFSKMDSTYVDLDNIGDKPVLNIEKVECPIRGECPFEGRICMPVFNTKLTERQKKIARMLYEGRSKEEIAEGLFLSRETVNNHIRNIYRKLDVHTEADFVRYVANNKVF